MVKQKREDKWHEEVFVGVIFAVMGLMLVFKGYSKLLSGFIHDGIIEGGATKQKGIIAFFSMLENAWWSWLIVIILLLLSYVTIRAGIKKYKSNS